MSRPFLAPLAILLGLACRAQAPSAPAPAAPVQAPEAATAAAKPRVKLVTNYGVLVLELEPQAAPATVANFLRYVHEGFYKGTVFHRIIPNFMIQGGGMTEQLEEKPSHDPILNESEHAEKAGLKNTRGTLSMARTENPNSATAQFFINVVDNPSLDSTPGSPGYCVFGRVVSGMEVADAISKARTVWRKGMPSVPDFAVRIRDAVELPAEATPAPAK
ncbi:MAG TPA: peptidylprolyl isomerase [Holophagaceae bacterium]|nr:peptidylprolyl isomerase [Holophagaceae bacterium]